MAISTVSAAVHTIHSLKPSLIRWTKDSPAWRNVEIACLALVPCFLFLVSRLVALIYLPGLRPPLLKKDGNRNSCDSEKCKGIPLTH